MAEIKKTKSSDLAISVSGKLVAIEQIQGQDRLFYVNRIVIPAIDEYSRPTEVPVYSDSRFANEGEIVNDINCSLQFSKRKGKSGGWFDNVSVWKL